MSVCEAVAVASERAHLDVVLLLFSELVVRPRARSPSEDVSRDIGVLEAIVLCDPPARVLGAAHDEYGLVGVLRRQRTIHCV